MKGKIQNACRWTHTTGSARWLSRKRLLLRLTPWVSSTGQKEKTDSHSLSSDHCVCSVTWLPLHTKWKNKNIKNIHDTFNIYMPIRKSKEGWKMAQWIKSLLSKLEGLSLDLQHAYKRQAREHASINPVRGQADRRLSRTQRSVSLGNRVQTRLCEQTCLKK